MIGVKLSLRLQEIYNLINVRTIADIGTDHAFLPIALIENGKCDFCVAVDIAEGPLRIAQKHIKERGYEAKIMTCLNDGIPEQYEVEGIVVAGMGNDTAISILNKADLSKYKQIIVQINTKTNLLRSWLSKHNYTIKDESICFDKGHYYEIVSFDTSHHEQYPDSEIYLGPILMQKRGDSYLKYLNKRLTQLMKIAEYNSEVNSELAFIKEYLNKEKAG